MVIGQRPCSRLKLVGRAAGPAGRASEAAGMASDLAGNGSEVAAMNLEGAGRGLEAAWRASKGGRGSGKMDKYKRKYQNNFPPVESQIIVPLRGRCPEGDEGRGAGRGTGGKGVRGGRRVRGGV